MCFLFLLVIVKDLFVCQWKNIIFIRRLSKSNTPQEFLYGFFTAPVTSWPDGTVSTPVSHTHLDVYKRQGYMCLYVSICDVNVKCSLGGGGFI